VAKILVADDNSNIQKMVGLALKDQGIDVVAVGNGEAAVRKISDVKPDLVLADVFMPVRNGYEVCRYVKEDSSLAHIPVILLVGAFDPLDEQEAQRVGADGVLKKPFVPPDPLISMVKSALARAGVALGAPPAAPEKVEAPSRNVKDLLSPGTGAKLPGIGSENLPQAAVEPVEEFATPLPPVKFANGQEPVAFGSLLGTPEVEDDPAFLPKPQREMGEERNWGADADEPVEEEGEEDSPRGGWRPGGLEEAMEEVAASRKKDSDWREQAFHGSSPANGSGVSGWAPAVELPHTTEIAQTPSVGVSTLDTKPAEPSAPFSSDAWAAAMAAGVEEKLAENGELTTKIPDSDLGTTHNPTFESISTASQVPSDLPAEEVITAPPADSWFSSSSSPWEMEAKKASLLASTWDSGLPQPSPALPEMQTAHDQSSETVDSFFSSAPPPADEIETSHFPSNQIQGSELAHTAELHQTHLDAHSPEETQEIPVRAEVAPDWPAHAPHEQAPAPAPEPQTPNMDELVARVLQKMSPDVMQKVTQEILKPVIEALLRDELGSKK
jgi:CheY-like chemotaxis protein